MQIEKISIKNFKTLEEVAFEPGKVNVFVGANGSGKSTLLEGIGILSAAMMDRVDNNSMYRRGIRLSTSDLYTSNFKDTARRASTIGFGLSWKQDQKAYAYHVNLNVPNEKDASHPDMWRYHSEALSCDGKSIWGRSGASRTAYDPYVGLFMLEPNHELLKLRDQMIALRDYAIYQPNTPTLRGTQVDPYQGNPLGLFGGRLAEALNEMTNKDADGEPMLGDILLDEVLSLIDWAADMNITAPKKSSINASVPTTRLLIEFQDRFMRAGTKFTAYDASEGALYVLFLLCLAMHEKSPQVFAIDSFDHAMHPRLARAATRAFSEAILRKEKTVFVTTHNPLVLDGLNLTDDRIRLFAVDKNHRTGRTTINRILVTEAMLQTGYSLSRLWIEGRLGGVPHLL